jgi:bifunctional DNase/RNase
MIPVQVKELAFDLSLSPVVLLADESGQNVLPIWVGPFEAQAIFMAMQGVMTPRPMTHDLFKSLCEYLGASLRSVVITDIKDDTYFAEIYLQTVSGEVIIDSRPSDAIALALRTGAKLYLSEKIAERTMPIEELIDENQQEEFQRLLGLNGPDDYRKSLH